VLGFFILESSRRPSRWKTRFLLGLVISSSIATVTASVISYTFSALPYKLLIHTVIFILALTGFYFILAKKYKKN
jgi:antibiotic biosynthesis monooxygenase (ABM) superfamily enzyme